MNEALWRLLGLPLDERYLDVTRLDVRLENGQRVSFNKYNFQDTILSPKTTLTAFSNLVRKNLLEAKVKFVYYAFTTVHHETHILRVWSRI